MLRIGLTGGIGSGKTTVAKIFEVLGIPVYYADDAAKLLMNTDVQLKKEIIRNFGSEAYNSGQLNRKFLASLVFNDKEKLAFLNGLTHPVTIRHAEEWMKKQTAPYIVKEAALLFESGASEYLDFVIGVFAPESLRIARVIQRDQLSSAEISKRISRQMDEETKMKLCDFVVTNNEEQLLLPQVLLLHQRFSRKN